MKCVLIDDEPMDLMALSELMSSYKEMDIVGKLLLLIAIILISLKMSVFFRRNRK